jgi:hypothetical protein
VRATSGSSWPRRSGARGDAPSAIHACRVVRIAARWDHDSQPARSRSHRRISFRKVAIATDPPRAWHSTCRGSHMLKTRFEVVHRAIDVLLPSYGSPAIGSRHAHGLVHPPAPGALRCARHESRSVGGLVVTRSARCCCGGLRAETTGEPAFVLACHCLDCQRRTGATFGVGAYFDRAQVRVEGASFVYTREGQAGRCLRFHFCPTCGTTTGTSTYSRTRSAWPLARSPTPRSSAEPLAVRTVKAPVDRTRRRGSAFRDNHRPELSASARNIGSLQESKGDS